MESPTTKQYTLDERRQIVAEYRDAKGDKAKVHALAVKYGVPGKRINDWARAKGPAPSRREHSDEFKREVIAYSREHTAVDAAKKYGVARSLIQKWRNKFPSKPPPPKNLALKKKGSRGGNLGPAHPKELKAEALKAVAAGEHPAKVAARLKLPVGTVTSWAWKARTGNASGRRRKDPVALGNEALGLKVVPPAAAFPNGVRRGTRGAVDPRPVLKALRDLRGRGTTIESVTVEGSTCTITYRVSEMFEF